MTQIKSNQFQIADFQNRIAMVDYPLVKLAQINNAYQMFAQFALSRDLNLKVTP